MLKQTSLPSANVAATERLKTAWGNRFRINLSVISDIENITQVIDLATATGKASTAEKILRKLAIFSELSGVLTNQLLSYLDNIVDLFEARRLAQALVQVYTQLIECYQQETLPMDVDPYLSEVSPLRLELLKSSLKPSLDKLELALTPHLQVFQKAHEVSPDPRMIGFLTTLFHFANQNILNLLNPVEKVLLTPYLRFVEEQVCIPWHRVCQSAAQHSPTHLLWLWSRSSYP
jgi:hypothetical protein